MSKEDVTTLRKVANFIPQVYFDIIGRIIPGTLIMGSIWLAVRGPDKFWESLKNCLVISSASSITVSATLILLTSYILAILLWCAWSRWVKKKCTNSKASKIRKYLEKMYWDTKEFRENYEKVKYNNISAGNRITKLKAQIHMAETLFIGFPLSCLIGFVINIWSFFGSNMETPPLIPCLVSLVLLFVAAIYSRNADLYFISHMKDSLKNNLELIKNEKKI